MDKNAIKKYAVWARRELISRVSQRAALYEITDKGFGDASADSVLGRVMSAEEKRQRQALITQIREKGYEQVMEEIAYTWFNRFIALRFMEVNGYLPSRVRIFTDDENNFKPQILAEAINMELDGLDMEKVYALKNSNDDDTLFKYMIIVQCNALSSILPGMFQRISDYTELLFPDNLLREGSVIDQMVSMIPEEDWTDQVQIIGWLYQYYNTEPKDKVFADLKKNIKISKENIPAATQLFTPDWIVRYMVENSLGRLWLEGHPNDELKASWKYYLDEAEQEPDVQAQLAEIRKEYSALKPEDIRAIDPCQGSGHILAYMFDVLVQIYESYGYTAREAAASIVEHNIWGLDIDDRAAQLAYFSVMMKARQYDRRFFSRGIQPHVYAIQESNSISSEAISYFAANDDRLLRAMNSIADELKDAKEYGSILKCSSQNWKAIYDRITELENEQSLFNSYANQLLPVVRIAEALSNQYHVVITNPPYMGLGGMSQQLSNYIKAVYPDSKSDLFAAFIERCAEMTLPDYFQSMITQHTWMFLSNFESLRLRVLENTIINMVHLGARAFEEIGGEVVQTTSFILQKSHVKNHIGLYSRLVDPSTQQGKEDMFLAKENRFFAKQDNYGLIAGSPVAYWISEQYFNAFNYRKLGEQAQCRKGLDTGDNNRFLRLWFEPSINRISFSTTTGKDVLWCPINKGGPFRKWYGNNSYVVWWKDDALEIRQHPSSYPRSMSFSFREGFTWSSISTGTFAARYIEGHFAFDSTGSMGFASTTDETLAILGFLNSKVCFQLLKIMEPTIHYSAGTLSRLPIVPMSEDKASIIDSVRQCISLCKEDWNSGETSWDFKRHPMVAAKTMDDSDDHRTCFMFSSVQLAYENWRKERDQRYKLLKETEERLNRVFIRTYCLEGELSPEVDDKDVTVHKANLQSDIKSLVSYAVGCMFGRYSLDIPGLAYAGGTWDMSKYTSFKPDRDAIIPISDDEYFQDDIVNRFIRFIEIVYGKDLLEENLRFIADALGGKGTPRDVIREYFINDFFKDHCNMYSVAGSGKRPIYWLFDSGKKNGFKCLIYMHRYQPDTIARIRTDYVHEQQSRYRTAIADLESRIASAGTGERVKLSKQLTKLQEQAEELRVYEEKIHHLADQMIRIDLDDGVKHNYAIFQDVLAKIK